MRTTWRLLTCLALASCGSPFSGDDAEPVMRVERDGDTIVLSTASV